MYNVFLVDDEPFIIEGLKALIPWEDYGLKVVGSANNGIEALRKLEHYKCDILLTDITMPEMNGLELIKKWKTTSPETKCIVLTGFQEFEYVKEGMTLGIENYLLKPVDEKEFIATLKNTEEKLKKSLIQEEAFYVLRDNTIWRGLNQEINSREWRERLALYQIQFDESKMAILTIQIDMEEKISSKVLFEIRASIELVTNKVCIVNPEGELNVLLTFEESDDQMKQVSLIKEILTGHRHIERYFIFIGSTVSSSMDFHKSLLVANELSSYRLLFEKSRVIREVDINQYQMKELGMSYDIEKIVKLITANRRSEAYEWVNTTIEGFYHEEPHLTPTFIQGFAIETITSIQRAIKQYDSHNITELVREIFSIKSLSELKEKLILFIKQTLDLLTKKMDHRSPIIQSVLNYIHESYHEEQSLKTLSQKFHVNSIYLGQLFQKEMGSVFSDYINQLRINKAKELLQDTYLKAGEIGKRVGYSDSTYFYKQFKKSVGVTPKEYKSLIVQNPHM